MSNDLVAYSRQGDQFHYRWAARRCLHMVYPNTDLQYIIIEGSSESELSGEMKIDVSEYYENEDGQKSIKYYQLKHSTVQVDDPFTLSDLKETFEEFALRYKELSQSEEYKDLVVTFTILTNRVISKSFKSNLIKVSKKQKATNEFKKNLESYTKLSSEELSTFCDLIKLVDNQGHYDFQKNELGKELDQIVSGSIDNRDLDTLIALISDRATKEKQQPIRKEEVLQRLGVYNERQLFPAPTKFEQLDKIISREQNNKLWDEILKLKTPVILEAHGGVGKTIFCRQILDSIPAGSIGILYDCFGGGSYRRQSEARHQHRQGLVQIANELASKGLCKPLIVRDTSLDKDILFEFLNRIRETVCEIQKLSASANLVILIDAADNAEMAASEFNDCFVNKLLKENIPEACKLVFLCRPERTHLLKPSDSIPRLELLPFSEVESFLNLKEWFPTASEADGKEFHRLTGGNPRVQFYVLSPSKATLSELLSSIGPGGMTVQKQIEYQLEQAVTKLRESVTIGFQDKISSICFSLASLPPLIPLAVLSKAAEVSEDEIRSFLSDFGPSLWLSDNSVQFRDEPTETWFTERFLAQKVDFEKYILRIEPLANNSSYVGQALPRLYLKAEQYEKLIDVSLSDEFLPTDNPVEARNIRIYRLEFAFKAALRANKIKDAIKIAMRSGEEFAGNQRQLALFEKNTDLLVLLQGPEKIQEIVFKRLLHSGWEGSSNVFAASLLSGIEDFKGEARNYLRSALSWLRLSLEKQKEKNEQSNSPQVTNADFVELAIAHLNLFGAKKAAEFLMDGNPKEIFFTVVKDFVHRLIDLGKYGEIDVFLDHCSEEQYFTIAIADELLKVGKFPEFQQISKSFKLISSKETRIPKSRNWHKDQLTPAILSFMETITRTEVSKEQIYELLDDFSKTPNFHNITSLFDFRDRGIYLRTLAIRCFLEENKEPDLDKLLPKEIVEEKKSYDKESKINQFKEVVNGLLPWYLLRLQIITGQKIDLLEASKLANESSIKARTNRYHQNDPLPGEIAQICADLLILANKESSVSLSTFFEKYLNENPSFKISSRIKLLRAANRLPHLFEIRKNLEISTRKLIEGRTKEGPEETGQNFISLARAVVINSNDDASAYFDKAVTIVSKFGDELTQRWDAVVSIAKQSFGSKHVSDELGYRFFRCAELVGERVYREKHWDRSEAVLICSKLSSRVALPGISRWRDRDIGYFENHVYAVLQELMESKKISPSVGWSFNMLFDTHEANRYLSCCLTNEPSLEKQKVIFDDAVEILRKEGSSKENWQKLKEIGINFGLENRSLNEIVEYYNSLEKPKEITENHFTSRFEEFNWEKLFENFDPTKSGWLPNLIQFFIAEFDKGSYSVGHRQLVLEALNRIPENSIWGFIQELFESDNFNNYDVQYFLVSFKTKWGHKISFEKKWPNIIYRFGEKFALEFTNHYSLDSFTRELLLDENLVENLKSGIFSGLSQVGGISKPDIFFEFGIIFANQITSDEACELLDYALSRFELHIEEDFGDGLWRDELRGFENLNKNLAFLIWSALGSPRSNERWKAAHCVRKLADLNCLEILNELIPLLEEDSIGSYGFYSYPFYNLHARLYLLIALERVSIDQPSLLKKWSSQFLKYALSEDHILIQKFASGVAKNLELASSGMFTQEILDSLYKIGESQLASEERDYDYSVDSYWHRNNLVKPNINFHFGLDLGQYWFEPLGEVFGISKKQIEELVADLVVNEWQKGGGEEFLKDPRQSLWSDSFNKRETWHRHSDYPRTDSFDFYLSYHALMVVAGRLIEKMPIISTRDWEEDPWSEWLSRHLLGREDGRWLSDSRDPLPIRRPNWIYKSVNKNWKSDVSDQDYISYLVEVRDGQPYISVKENREERKDSSHEIFSVCTALVSRKTSVSLMRALADCENPYDYKLPEYGESGMEFNSDFFRLIGWIKSPYSSSGLDTFDPYAGNVYYPGYSPGESIIEFMGLVNSEDGKSWKSLDSDQSVLISESWISLEETYDKEPNQNGRRLQASLSFLLKLCSEKDIDLIFDVGIKRNFSHKYDPDTDREFTLPKHKIFILSADGTFRDTEKNYYIGKASGRAAQVK